MREANGHERLERRPAREDADLARAREELRYVKKILADAARSHGPAFAQGVIVTFGADGVPAVEHRDVTVSRATLAELRRRLDAAMGSQHVPERRALAALAPEAIRAEAPLRRPMLSGHAIVFHSLSADLGGFFEKVDPRAVERTLRDGIDVLALADHDSGKVLGRVSAGTLHLGPDARGLHVEIEPPDTSTGRDILTLVGRGDLRGMSFAFRTIKDAWAQGADGALVRTLLDLMIHEVSIVALPAYPATSVHVRGLPRHREDLARQHERVRLELQAARRRLVARWN